jgi:hypothetical protein
MISLFLPTYLQIKIKIVLNSFNELRIINQFVRNALLGLGKLEIT